MKLKLRIINFFLILFFLSFENKNNKEEEKEETVSTTSIYKESFNNTDEIEKLKKAIKMEGDTIAFLKLQEIYFNSGNKNDFLFYSMSMANSYNYNGAYFANYMILHTDIINDKNKVNNMYANYYLLKAYENGHKHVLNSIKIRFNSEHFPTSKDYWNSNLKGK